MARTRLIARVAALLLALGVFGSNARPVRQHVLVLALDADDANVGLAKYTLEAHGIPHTVRLMRGDAAPLNLDPTFVAFFLFCLVGCRGCVNFDSVSLFIL
jgi:hypothetical protein